MYVGGTQNRPSRALQHRVGSNFQEKIGQSHVTPARSDTDHQIRQYTRSKSSPDQVP